MSRTEAALNKKIMKALVGLHPIRVENPACPGTPDINAAGDIWIESKVITAWPSGGVVRVPHFTPQQRTWHIHRFSCKGHSFVCLQVGKNIFLLDGFDAAKYLGKSWWQQDIEAKSLSTCLGGELSPTFKININYHFIHPL